MSFFEPAVWLRTHRLVIGGTTIERMKGEPVGFFGYDWRKTRRQHKEWFYASDTNWNQPPDQWAPGNVRVWFQEKATQDTIIASWLAELFHEEGHKYAITSVDCVASVDPAHMDEISYVSNQVQYMTGPRQTAKIRITDVRFARMIKQAGEKVITHCRRVRRVKTKLNGRSPDSNSTKLDVMYITHAMHASMVADNNKNDGVVKAGRMFGCLAYKPTEKRLTNL